MKIIKLLILTLILVPNFCRAQYYYNSFQSAFFFSRQPSPKAEAMGKGYVSMSGELSSQFYNPAGISPMEGPEVNTSFATPCYMLGDAVYDFIGAGYKINKYLVLGLNRRHLRIGKFILTDIYGNNMATYMPFISNYTITIASQPIRNLHIGLNTNLFREKFFDGNITSTVHFDFGLIKSFYLSKNKKYDHKINLGGSITNFSYSKINIGVLTPIEEELPVISRVGLSYQLPLLKGELLDSINTIEFLIHTEYQDLLNSDYRTAIRFGGEIKLLEIIALRIGYYTEYLYDYNLPQYNKSKINDFTYGLGIHLPINKLAKKRIPINLSIDYTTLPQVDHTKSQRDWDNFHSLGVRFNWVIGRKKSKK